MHWWLCAICAADCCVCCRDGFACEQQFNIVSKYIVDSTQTATVKVCQTTSLNVCLSVNEWVSEWVRLRVVVCVYQVKLSVLNYLHGLCQSMDPTELTNTGDTRLAITRIITWTTDPKSVDIRKVISHLWLQLLPCSVSDFERIITLMWSANNPALCTADWLPVIDHTLPTQFWMCVCVCRLLKPCSLLRLLSTQYMQWPCVCVCLCV